MINFGFYDSVNHDRRYFTKQFSHLWDGIIRDGVFMSIGLRFQTLTMNDGMKIVVRSGKAWLNHSWIENDEDLVLEVPAANPVYQKKYAVVIDINQRKEARRNDIFIVEAWTTIDSSGNVLPPDTYVEMNHYRYPIAYITLPANAKTISQSNIEYLVGRSWIPYVTGILDTVNTDDLLLQWRSEWNSFIESRKDLVEQMGEEERRIWMDWFRSYINENQLMIENFEKEFKAWLESLRDTLDGDVAANLAAEIEKIKMELGNFRDVRSELLLYHGLHDDLMDEESDPIRDGEGDIIEGLSVKFQVVPPEKETYEQVFDIHPQDHLLLYRDGLIKTISQKKFMEHGWDLIDEFCTHAPFVRKVLWRGQNIGEKPTEEQYENIRNGTFKGMFLGDFWHDRTSGYFYRIMDFDYWITPWHNVHHVVLLPDRPIGGATSWGLNVYYLDGIIRRSFIPNSVKPVINQTFPDEHIFKYQDYYPGVDYQKSLTTASIEVPSANMMLGSNNLSYDGDVGRVCGSNSRGTRQLIGLTIEPYAVNIAKTALWLSDFVLTENKTWNVIINQNNIQSNVNGDFSSGYVRPVFGICHHNG